MLTANICRNAAAIAFRLGGRITTGTPCRPQNVYRNGVPVRSGTTTPLLRHIINSLLRRADATGRVYIIYRYWRISPFCGSGI